MRRAATTRRLQIDRTDAVVFFAVVAVAFSYFVGAGLDWSQLSAATTAPTASAAQGRPGPDGRASGPHAAAPTPSDPAWDELVRQLAARAIGFDGRVAIYLKDLQKGRIWAYHADDLFPSASLIKVPIMVAVFDKIRRGELSMQTRVRLARRHRTGGSGSLKWYRDGSRFTVRHLIEKMIDESDNTATRMLIEEVGLSYLQQQFPKMGLVYTEIFPEGLSLRNSGVTTENYTTAREMAGLLDRMYRGEAVDRYASQAMLDIMKRKRVRARLAKTLPRGWEIAHKTGLLRRACHDSAVIFSPKGDYILVVLTGQNRSYGQAKDFITKLGTLTYRYYRDDPSFLARVPEFRVARRPRGSDDVN